MYSNLGRGHLAQRSTCRDTLSVEHTGNDDDGITYVNEPSPEDVQDLTQLYNTLSRAGDEHRSGVHQEFSDFLEEKRGRYDGGLPLRRLAVSFRDVTTWGIEGEATTTKTFVDAVRRTLVMRDIYEWTIKPWLRKPSRDECRPLIRNISGAVRDGEMML